MSRRTLPIFLSLFSLLLTSAGFAQVDVEVEVQGPAPQVVELERPPVRQAYRPAPIQPVPVVVHQPVVQRPHRLRYSPGLPIPPGGRLVERYRVGMLIAGAAMFAVPYAIGLTVMSEFESPVLAVPLIGPFLAMREATVFAAPFLVLDGLVQLTGATLLIIGLTVKKRYIQMYASEDGQRTLSVLPFAGQSNGLSLNLTF